MGSPADADITTGRGPVHEHTKIFGAGKRPHPLPMTMGDLAEGIKRLRAAYVAVEMGTIETDGQAERRQLRLYRGMKMLDVGDTFMHECQGGTEIAPMSTTTELEVAVHYGLSPESLLFVLVIDNAVQMGADVQWVSAFPAEAEVRQ